MRKGCSKTRLANGKRIGSREQSACGGGTGAFLKLAKDVVQGRGGAVRRPSRTEVPGASKRCTALLKKKANHKKWGDDRGREK